MDNTHIPGRSVSEKDVKDQYDHHKKGQYASNNRANGDCIHAYENLYCTHLKTQNYTWSAADNYQLKRDKTILDN